MVHLDTKLPIRHQLHRRVHGTVNTECCVVGFHRMHPTEHRLELFSPPLVGIMLHCNLIDFAYTRIYRVFSYN